MVAISPEELETLLEDAVLLHDEDAVAALFEDRGVVVTGAGRVWGRAQAADQLSDYLAAGGPVMQVRDVAVAVGTRTVNVTCCGPDRRWRLLLVVVLDAS